MIMYTCIANNVYMQDDYVYMKIFMYTCVDNYVYMQDNYVYIST